MTRRSLRATAVGALSAALTAALLAATSPPAQAVAGPVAWEASNVLTGLSLGAESGLQHDVAVLPDGRVAASYVLQKREVAGDIYDRPLRVYLRDLDGDWTLDAQLTGTTTVDGVALIESPPLHATSDGRLVTAIRVPDNATTSSSVLDSILAKVRSSDGQWTSEVMEADTIETDGCADFQGARVGSSGSRLMVTWTCIVRNEAGNETGRVTHARVHDGSTWSAIETLGTAVSVAPDGIVALPGGAFAVLTLLPGDTDPMTVDSKVTVFVRAADGTWTSTTFAASQQPWDIVAQPDGGLVVTYFDTANKAVRRSPAGAWGAAEDYDGTSSGTQSVLAALGDGRVVAAWSLGPSVQASVRSAAGVWGAPTVLAATGGNFVRVASDDEGNTAVTWTDTVIPAVRSATLPAGSGTWSAPALLATVSSAGVSAELAVAGSTFASVWATAGSLATYFDVRAAVGAGGAVTGPPPPPATTGRTAVSGTFRVGQVVSCASPTWAPGPVTLAYQWLRSGSPIVGATTSKRTLALTDLSRTIACRVTATNTGGSRASTSLAYTVNKGFAPVATVKPSIGGTLRVGKTLTCARGVWSPSYSYTYKRQWYRGSTKISGAVYYKYKVKAIDKGKRLKCRVQTIRSGYLTGAANSASRLIR